MKKFLFILLFTTGLLVTGWAQQTFYGKASYYHDKFNGRKTANGEQFNNNALTAAHNTLPFNTLVRVTNLKNNLSVDVRINDRGPFAKNRIIDLTRAAANRLDMIQSGVADVKIEVLASDYDSVSVNQLNTNTLYQVQISKVKKPGYGIQVASYSNLQNLLDDLAGLEENFTGKLMFHTYVNESNTLYRLIIGPFETNEEALLFLEKLKALGKEGLVIDLKNLK